MSPTPEPRSKAPLDRTISRVLRQTWSHWTGAVWVTAIVAFALPVWWRTGLGAYESYLVVALKKAAILSRESELKGRAAGSDEARADFALLRDLEKAPRLDAYGDERPLTMQLSPPTTAAVATDAARFELTCRGGSPLEAQRRCTDLMERSLSLDGALEIVERPSLPRQPASVARGPVVLTATGLGLLSGLLWMLGCALLIKKPAPEPVKRPEVASSRPPPRPFNEKPPVLRVVPVKAPTDAAPAKDLRQLCEQVYALAAQGSFLIGVSSWPQDEQQKTRVAAQLAWALAAERNARVLLLEADLEKPAVDRVTGVVMPPLTGFTQQIYLRGEHENAAPWSVVRSGTSLSVLAEGRLRTPGLPKPERLLDAARELRRSYDIIVADTPVARRSADVRLLERLADGVVFAIADASLSAETAPSLSKWFPEKELVSIVIAEASS